MSEKHKIDITYDVHDLMENDGIARMYISVKIKCPWCDNTIDDFYIDYPKQKDEESMYCADCDKEFIVEVSFGAAEIEVEVGYRSEQCEDRDQESDESEIAMGLFLESVMRDAWLLEMEMFKEKKQ
jgi:hypothetical protein